MASCKPSYLRDFAAFDRCCLSLHHKVGLQRGACSDAPLKLLGSRLSKMQPSVHVWRWSTTYRSLTVIKSCMGDFADPGHMDVAHHDLGPMDVMLDHNVYPNFVLGRDVFQDPSSMTEITPNYSQAVDHPEYADLARTREAELAAFMAMHKSQRRSKLDEEIVKFLTWAVTSFPWQATAWFLLAGCVTAMGHGVGSEGQPLHSEPHFSSSSHSLPKLSAGLLLLSVVCCRTDTRHPSRVTRWLLTGLILALSSLWVYYKQAIGIAAALVITASLGSTISKRSPKLATALMPCLMPSTYPAQRSHF